MRIQHGSSARATNAIRVYEGAPEAILLLIAGDADAHQGLTRVFALHDAPVVDLERELPDLGQSIGDCVIGDDGILMTMNGIGRYLMGVRLQVTWGRTEPFWRETAMGQGRVWVGLLPHPIHAMGPAFRNQGIPEIPVLKLEALTS